MKQNPSILKKPSYTGRSRLIIMADTTDLIMKIQYHGKRRIASILGIPAL